MSINRQNKTRRSGMNGKSAALCAAAVIIAVLLNLLVLKLPSSATKLDMTNNSLLSLSDQTRELVSSLDKDVEVFWIVQEGREDDTLGTVLSRYEELSSRLTVTKIDPVGNPTLVMDYEEELKYNNSILVRCEGRAVPIPFTDIYIYDEASYSYYSSFNGENAITNAILRLSSDELPVVYVLEGHGEQTLGGAASASLEGQGYDVQPLSIIAAQEIPSDCSVLLIFDPQNDISEFEQELIRQYMADGGSIFLMTSYTAGRMERLEALMESRGASRFGEIVVDSQQFVSNAPIYLLPTIAEHSITAPFMGGNYTAVLPLCQAILIDNAYTEFVKPILTTSEIGIAKQSADDLSVISVEEGDVCGVLNLAVALETDCRAVWVASSYLVEENAVSWSAGTNNDLFINCTNWLIGAEDGISIHPKPIDMTEVLTIPADAGGILTTFVVFIIPFAALLAGLAVVIVRRRK